MHGANMKIILSLVPTIMTHVRNINQDAVDK